MKSGINDFKNNNFCTCINYHMNFICVCVPPPFGIVVKIVRK